MKKIENPFGVSAYEKLERASTEYLKACKQLEDLKNIRKMIAEGNMKESVYDFINADGSLESLLCNLPRPSDDIACEALTSAQLMYLDATISAAEEGLGDFLRRIWEAFKEWFLDWWDRNRYTRIKLRKMKAQFTTNPQVYGDSSSFDATTVYSYSCVNWYKLVDAVKHLNAIVASIPSDSSKAKDWVDKNRPESSQYLAEFGKFIDNEGYIRDGNPKYNKIQNTLVNGRWRYQEIGRYIDDVVKVMDDEIAYRKQFNDIEHLFTSNDPTDKKTFMFVKKIVMRTKEQALHVGRSLELILNKVQRDAASHYRIP